jgi:hypothetical protein
MNFLHKLFLLFLILPFCIHSQNNFSLVNDSINKQKFSEISLVKNLRKYRGRNTLLFECNNKQQIKYSDDESDENYVKFEELGKFKKNIVVIQKTDYNSEKYILLDTINCRQIILDGLPLKINDEEKYIVFNNPGTDEKYKLEVLEFRSDFFEISNTIIFPNEILPKRILKVSNKEVYVLDKENKIWKTTL